ncbi:hypothetical protein BG004_003870 [Podila humilis]|nr:hypothetical protein BG004_003870 [Podila humilis]
MTPKTRQKSSTQNKRSPSPSLTREPPKKRTRPANTANTKTKKEKQRNDVVPRQKTTKSRKGTAEVDVKVEPDRDEDIHPVVKTGSETKIKEESDPDIKEESGTKIKNEPKEEPTATEIAHGTVKREEDVEAKTESRHTVLEKGQAYFFYRRKIDSDTVSGLNDIQKLYLLLSPDDAVGRIKTEGSVKTENKSADSSVSDTNMKSADEPQHRLIIIPRKCLPTKTKGNDYNQPGARNWAFVDTASPELPTVVKNLREYTYSTKTRGDRTQVAACLVAEARYEIVFNHDQKRPSSHFLYTLEVPLTPGKVQEVFNIAQTGQFFIQVKNPEIQTPATERGAQRFATLKKSAAKLPKYLQEKFKGVRADEVRYRPMDTVEFLNVPHLEMVLFAAGYKSEKELAEVLEELEKEVDDDIKDEIEAEDQPEDHVYKELTLDEETIPDAIHEFK